MPRASYELVYRQSVAKDLRKLSQSTRQAIVVKIQTLVHNPYSTGSTKLRGATSLFRVRHGDYRIIYQVKDRQLIIIIIKIGHRKDVYRAV